MLYQKIKCPDCEWAQFERESAAMTPCYNCNSTGYVYQPIDLNPNEMLCVCERESELPEYYDGNRPRAKAFRDMRKAGWVRKVKEVG